MIKDAQVMGGGATALADKDLSEENREPENERTWQPERAGGGGGTARDSWFLSMPVKPQCYFPTSLTVKSTVCLNTCSFLSPEA